MSIELSPAYVAFWNAVNHYAEACGGDGSKISDARMDAVVAVERALDAFLKPDADLVSRAQIAEDTVKRLQEKAKTDAAEIHHLYSLLERASKAERDLTNERAASEQRGHKVQSLLVAVAHSIAALKHGGGTGHVIVELEDALQRCSEQANIVYKDELKIERDAMRLMEQDARTRIAALEELVRRIEPATLGRSFDSVSIKKLCEDARKALGR